jgi:hypothetical protein
LQLRKAIIQHILKPLSFHETFCILLVLILKSKYIDKYNVLTYIAKGLTIDDPAFKTALCDKVNFVNLTATFAIPKASSAEQLTGYRYL